MYIATKKHTTYSEKDCEDSEESCHGQEITEISDDSFDETNSRKSVKGIYLKL